MYGGRLCDAMYCVQISFAVCLIMVERGLSGGNLEDLEQVFNVNLKSYCLCLWLHFLRANLLHVINCLGSKARRELLVLLVNLHPEVPGKGLKTNWMNAEF